MRVRALYEEWALLKLSGRYLTAPWWSCRTRTASPRPSPTAFFPDFRHDEDRTATDATEGSVFVFLFFFYRFVFGFVDRFSWLEVDPVIARVAATASMVSQSLKKERYFFVVGTFPSAMLKRRFIYDSIECRSVSDAWRSVIRREDRGKRRIFFFNKKKQETKKKKISA